MSNEQNENREPFPKWSDVTKWLKDKAETTREFRTAGFASLAYGNYQDVLMGFGNHIDAHCSSFFEKLITQKGAVSLFLDVPDNLVTLFVSILMLYAFHYRKNNHHEGLLLFVIDDSLKISAGSTHMESQGLFNPITDFITKQRLLNMGTIISTQYPNVLSPVILANTSNIIALRSADPILGKMMQLTPEQMAVLPSLQEGECVCLARSIWPRAVRGRFPEVK